MPGTYCRVLLHGTFPALRAVRWQEGYAAFSVSQSQVEVVEHYIAGQAEHHRQRSFEEELREFLSRHQIEFDERYLLG